MMTRARRLSRSPSPDLHGPGGMPPGGLGGEGAVAFVPARRRLVAALVLGLALPELAAQTEGGLLYRPWPRGRATPGLDLPAWEGGRWSLARSRGRVVVLNFWASWCPPCVTELPSLELLAARHESDGVEVLAVNFRETDAAVRRFLERQPLTLPVLRDADGAAAKAFGVRVFPTTVVVGRDGRAAFTVTGECDWGGPQARAWMAAVV